MKGSPIPISESRSRLMADRGTPSRSYDGSLSGSIGSDERNRDDGRKAGDEIPYQAPGSRDTHYNFFEGIFAHPWIRFVS